MNGPAASSWAVALRGRRGACHRAARSRGPVGDAPQDDGDGLGRL